MFGGTVRRKVHIFKHQTHTPWGRSLSHQEAACEIHNHMSKQQLPSSHLTELPHLVPSAELDSGNLCAPLKQFKCVPLFYFTFSWFLCIVIWTFWVHFQVFNGHLYFFCWMPIYIFLLFSYLFEGVLYILWTLIFLCYVYCKYVLSIWVLLI